MAPLTVIAGVGIFDMWKLVQTNDVNSSDKKKLFVISASLFSLWLWQQVMQLVESRNESAVIAHSAIVQKFQVLKKSGCSEFSVNPLWTFAAGQTQTPPELTILPAKRIWSGEVNDLVVIQSLASNHVDAIALNQSVLKKPVWTNFLGGYTPIARDGEDIAFARNELNLRPVKLDTQAEILHKIGY